MAAVPEPTVWPVLHYDAEMRWPGGGAIVFGSTKHVESPHVTELGSGVATRAFTARDPEGNLWTFGTYRGAHDKVAINPIGATLRWRGFSPDRSVGRTFTRAA